MYVVTGATGNTGSVIAEALLAKGEKVRVVGRSKERLESFTKKGAEPAVADLTDAAALTKAFSGASSVYAMIPPNPGSPDVRAYEAAVTKAIVKALEGARVSRIVLLSSVGADKPEKTGPVLGLHEFEEQIRHLPGVHALFIRAGYFMENLLPQTGVIKSYGMMAGPVRGDLPLPMIATQDIAKYAAEKMLRPDFEGKQARELLGQRDIAYNEVVRVIGAAIGRPQIGYMQMPDEQLKPALMQMGMSENMAGLLLEMAGALNSGYMTALEKRSPQNTTSTSIERFTNETFVPAFEGRAAHA
jgi:uncharacterized protein YbjT (DUF2867 family)